MDLETPNLEVAKRAKTMLPAFRDAMVQLVDGAPLQCLRTDIPWSLRKPMALLFLLGGDADRCDEVLNRPIEITVPPPPGGWRSPPGVPPGPDANLPKKRTFPYHGEAERLKAEVQTQARPYLAGWKNF